MTIYNNKAMRLSKAKSDQAVRVVESDWWRYEKWKSYPHTLQNCNSVQKSLNTE